MGKERYIRRKGRVFSAIQWNGKNQKEIYDFLGKNFVIIIDSEKELIVLQSFGRKLVAEKGDYIFRDNSTVFQPIIVMNEFDFNNSFEKYNYKEEKDGK